MTADKRIIVVGAGIGGIAAAMLLSAGGHEVTVLEKESVIGGKMRSIDVAGRAIDCGPTVVTMREVFEELFDACGLSLDDFVTMRKARVLARHAWAYDAHLDLFADPAESTDAIGRFAGRASADGFRRFSEHARGVYDTMGPLFMRSESPSPIGMVKAAGLRGLKGLVSSAPFTTLWDSLGQYFPDPRLRQLFGRYATYCGSSPFEAPATLAVIAHVEQRGVWLVDGGIRTFAKALRRAAQKAGVNFETDTEVREVLFSGSRASGVRLQTGVSMSAGTVVMNCDAAALVANLFGPAASTAVSADATQPRSLSAATWAMVARTDGSFPLSHHSVLFSRSSEAEFADLFQRNRPPEDPTVYICAQDRTANVQPETGGERLFLIVNAPADGGQSLSSHERIEQCRIATMRTLERCGLRLSIVDQTHIGPATFAARYPGTGGALYGMASHGWNASFRRPTVRTRIPGLYLTGGSVHPARACRWRRFQD